MSGDVHRRVPGRGAELEVLIDLYLAMVEKPSGGHVVYVVGDEGEGRTALLRDLVDELRQTKSPPALLAGEFDAGRFFPWDAPEALRARALPIVEQLVT